MGTEINRYLENIEEEILELLKEIVNIDSHSNDKSGVDTVAAVIKNKLEENNIPNEILANEDLGNHIIATVKGNKEGKILLMGHMDTVYPSGTVSKRPFENDGKLLRGPGVSDMKSGLVTMLGAAMALKEVAGSDICDIELLFTPDEEIGSPISRAVIEERSKNALAVFNLEAGRPDGSIVTARKGSAHLKIEIEGKAAHSGAFIEQGISANDELALKMTEIKKLMNEEKGITINFGKVKGGISNNVVSPFAAATIHIGFWTLEDFLETQSKIRSIVDTAYISGTKSILSGDISMLPMEKHDGVAKLYEIVQMAAKELNIAITEQRTKGAADAGFASSLGVPTICGMGPVGGNWHSEDEYLELESFLPRMKLLANSILILVRNSNLKTLVKV